MAMKYIKQSSLPRVDDPILNRALEQLDEELNKIARVFIDWTDASNNLVTTGTLGSGKLTVNSGGGQSIIIKGTSTGNANLGWIGFYDSDGTTRRGHIGDGSVGDDDIYIGADTGYLRLLAAGYISLGTHTYFPDDVVMSFGASLDYSIGYNNATGTLQIVDGATLGSNVRLKLDSSGHFDFGAGNLTTTGTLASGVLTVTGGITGKKAANYSYFNIETYATDPNKHSHLRLRTSDSDVLDTLSETQDGDEIGKIHFQGVDTGSNWEEGAWIKVVQNGAAGAYVPADMFLETYSATAINAGQLVLYADGTLSMSGALTVTQEGGSRFKRAGGDCVLFIDTFDTTPADFSQIHLRTSDSDTIDTLSETQDGDTLGRISFYGIDDANSWQLGARIDAVQNGAAGTGEVPADLIFETWSATAPNANQLVLVNDGTVTASGCITDGTCEIMKNENALSIIDDILKTGSGKKDEYKHERMDMKKIHQKYPFMIYERKGVDEEGNKTINYYDKLGAKSDLIYVAIGQLVERVEELEARFNN